MTNQIGKVGLCMWILCVFVLCIGLGAGENSNTDAILPHGRDLLKQRKDLRRDPKHRTSSKSRVNKESKVYEDLKECTDKDWCTVEAPTKSLFRFTTSIDPAGWKEAQIKAASGEQVLLSKIMEHFPTYLNFLDGDIKFRNIHHLADFFVDRNRDLSPLIATEPTKWRSKKAKEPYKWGNTKVLPRDHDFYPNKRAPIFKLGYYAFPSGGSLWFGSPELGKALVSRTEFSAHWQKVRDQVSRPHILLDVHDENWGLLSTHFPNRTAQWGTCCEASELAAMTDFLDHNMTLLALLNQHTNISHPKIVTLPRGLPLHRDHGARLIWDTMHAALHTTVLKSDKNVITSSSDVHLIWDPMYSKQHTRVLKKDKFVFTSSSDTLSRRDVLTCIGKKFDSADFTWEVRSSPEDKERRSKIGDLAYNKDYYTKLITTRVGIAPPGIGYDTFRLWELLTVGAVAVIEKGVGLDKTVWRLPVLLVEDFADVTPTLLRTAYVEAVYRAERREFEFQRLTQSWWFSFIMRVSRAQSTDAVLASFPAEAEDSGFTRPMVPFVCEEKDGKSTCGAGTKRTPRNSCL